MMSGDGNDSVCIDNDDEELDVPNNIATPQGLHAKENIELFLSHSIFETRDMILDI